MKGQYLLLCVVTILSCGSSITNTDPLEPSQLVRGPDGTIRYRRPTWCAPCAPCDCTCADPIGAAPITEHVLIGAQGTSMVGQNRPSFRATFTTPFWMGRHELTVRCVELCRRAGVCEAFTPDPRLAYLVELPQRADFPARALTKVGAQQACRFFGGDLPTSAQWEFAARGTDGRNFPWGDSLICDGGNYETIIGPLDFTSTMCRPFGPEIYEFPVGGFPRGAGPYGTLDLIGGVSEWVSDLGVGRPYYQSMAAFNERGTEPLDPTGPLVSTADTPEDYRNGMLRGPTVSAFSTAWQLAGPAPTVREGEDGGRCRWLTAPGL